MKFTRATLLRSALLTASARLAPARADELATVRYTCTIADDIRPMLYAQSAGLFHQAGLDVVMQLAGTGAIVAQSIVGGAMDVGKASITSIIAAYAQGIPFVLVAPGQLYRKDIPAAGIVVAATSPLRTALDLQGKVVSCSAIGDIAYLGLRAIIDARGGDSSTVKWIELTPSATVAAAIDQGRIDAGLLAEPAMMQGVRDGKVRFFIDMLSGYERPILEAVYFSTRDYATKKQDTVARFGKVMRQAAIYSNAHTAETTALLVAFAKMHPKVAAEMRHSFAATTFEPAQIQPVIDLAAKYKIIPHGFDAHQMMTTVVPQS